MHGHLCSERERATSCEAMSSNRKQPLRTEAVLVFVLDAFGTTDGWPGKGSMGDCQSCVAFSRKVWEGGVERGAPLRTR